MIIAFEIFDSEKADKVDGLQLSLCDPVSSHTSKSINVALFTLNMALIVSEILTFHFVTLKM